MKTMLGFRARMLCCTFLLGAGIVAKAGVLPGMGQLSGQVAGVPADLLTTVYALHTEKNVGYMVYVVDGRYRAVNLFPGRYQVTVRPAVGQLFTHGFTPQTVELNVPADGRATRDFQLKPAEFPPDYVGGMTYDGGWNPIPGTVPPPDGTVLPYDEIYPPGPGRDIMERTCHGCHTPNMFSYNVVRRYPSGRAPKDKAGWAITVDRMYKGVAFGVAGRPSYFDPALLPPRDRDILVDYLADNFGLDSEPRVIQLESEPELDEQALAKAQFIEYRLANTPTNPARGTQQIDFDGKGNIWVTDLGAPGSVVRIDPRTGTFKDYMGYGGGHGIVVDITDGTVWFSSMFRLDPETGIADSYDVKGGPPVRAVTHIFDSKGDLWMASLPGGVLSKWDRKTDSIIYWDVPILRSRPYGIIVDHNDKVWFGEYHNSGVARFDPETETFTHFQLEDFLPTNMRRPGVDSKNHIWIATWGSRGMQEGALYGLNPDTGEVIKRKMDIAYANPYTVAADEYDNIWIGTDNYLVKYDQEADTMTRYPVTVRTDMPKLTIAANGAIWFTPRNAGHSGGYGGSASVLHPDKDNIKTLAAEYAEISTENLLKYYKGPPGPEVTGVEKISPCGAQNAGDFADVMGLDEDLTACKGTTGLDVYE
jgi:virginiamycin B lyase